jgi:hypothetical protein
MEKWKLPDAGAAVKQVIDPSRWFIWAHWGGGRDDGPPTPDQRFVEVGRDEQGRRLWAGPFY